jgi:5-methylcytosine-specific restriction endonuclease McrBC GTP-binding regulatory subunit McrB
MTLEEAIDHLSKEQVDEWWRNAPIKATESAKAKNWKYYLWKNGKRLPFKWSLNLLFNDLLKKSIKINSDYATRAKFSEKFDFEVQEDLVYDDPQLSWLQEYYQNLVWNKTLFKNLINHLHEIVSKNQFEPYNVRAAISGSSKSMLIIGMRAVFIYRDHKTAINIESDLPHSEVDLILDQSFIAKYKGQAKQIKIENFTGHGKHCLVKFNIKSFDELDIEILNNHTKCIIEEYNHIAGNKIAQWNVEAKTTNDAFKAAIFKNLDIRGMKSGEKLAPKILLVNITWNSKDWKEKSIDKSAHDWVKEGNIPHESWNFDFDNPRNKDGKVYGFAQFTNPPKVDGDNNLIIFYSNKQIVGFYGSAEILKEYIQVNKEEDYNLIADQSLSLVLDNKIDQIKEQGFLEEKSRIGMIGFNYLKKSQTALDILNKAIELNPDQKTKLNAIKSWLTDSSTASSNKSNSTQYKESNMKSPLNQILYGPPGTGKTYSTIVKALSIIEDKSEAELEGEERIELKRRFDELVKSEQIVFSTFHQSMSYEDFVEGIKPVLDDDEEVLKYKVQEGIFQNACTNAYFSTHSNSETVHNAKKYSSAYDQLAISLEEKLEEGKEPKLNNKSGKPINFKGLTVHGNILLSPINSNQEYIISKDRIAKILNQNIDIYSINNIDKTFRDIIGGAYITGFWAVINEINTILKKPEFNHDKLNSFMTHEEKKVLNSIISIKEFKSEHPFILIIDEINRGNVSQIFGELITLIEEDKRAGNKEALEITLPYSKERFSVPNNLYIIGTMNTADRSVEALDSALRRRFSFQEMMPKPELLKEINWNGFEVSEILETINNRIEVLIDRDHTIGHSYFMGLESKENIEEALKSIFKDKIIPLLQEYFFNDYGKIQLVLGNVFIEEEKKKVQFATANNEIDKSDYEEKVIYKIAADYDLERALSALMGKEEV